MSSDRFEVLERFVPLFDGPEFSFERFVRRRDRKRRQRRIAAGVGASAVGAVLVFALATVVPVGDDPAEPNATIAVNQTTTTSTTTGPNETSAAIDLATRFVNAQAAFDADAVIGYLSDDFVGGQALGDFGRTPVEIRQFLSLSRAQRTRHLLQPCAYVESSEAGVVVRCPFDAHGFGSDELGFGPYTGQAWTITVRDGSIVAARIEWYNIERMIQDVVEPFGRWVQANHPDDVAVMYIDGNPTDFQISEASSRLWAQRLEEYLAEETVRLDTAEAFMAAWAEGDGDALAAMFAANGTWEGFEAAVLPAVHDWHRAIGGEFQHGSCALRAVLQQVHCSYRYQNDLTRFLGADPTTGTFALDIGAGGVTTANDSHEATADDAWQRFRAWVAETHPDDLERMYAADSGLATWEVPSIELWRRHVDEFVASEEGYIARADAICTAAHTRLNDELMAADVELEPGADDDGSLIQLVPSNDEDRQLFEDAARRIEREALLELFAATIPHALEYDFGVAYQLLERFVEDEAGADPQDLWRQVRDMELGLDHCTYSLST